MKKVIRCNSFEADDQMIKERISRDILSKISDYGLQTALRRILFYNGNKIDWQDAWQQIVDQMPEIR